MAPLTLSKLQIRAIVGQRIARLPREGNARNITDELERMPSSGNHYEVTARPSGVNIEIKL